MKVNQKGFTLIELVMVIVILAIIGAVAIPQFVNLRAEAAAANEKAVAGAVRAAILTFFIDPVRGNRQIYPANLDASLPNTDCSRVNPCFNNVLTQGNVTGVGITENWRKLSGGLIQTYRGGSSTTNVWGYNPLDGSFVKTAD